MPQAAARSSLAKMVPAQRVFTTGELDVEMKRNDQDDRPKLGGRQMSNRRIQNTKTITNRPGRRALISELGPNVRIEKIIFGPTAAEKFYLSFGFLGGGNGFIRIYDSFGGMHLNIGGLPWDEPGDLQNIVW